MFNDWHEQIGENRWYLHRYETDADGTSVTGETLCEKKLDGPGGVLDISQFPTVGSCSACMARELAVRSGT